MTDAQINETLAKAVGFKRCDCGEKGNICDYWVAPNSDEGISLPDFLNDMNACLTIIKPKLSDSKFGKLVYIHFSYNFLTGRVGCELGFMHKQFRNDGYDETESRAFCLAYLKFLEDKER